MTKHTDPEVLQRAAELLAAGLLPSLLPARLMIEFQLTRLQAAKLAKQALKARVKADE